MRISPKIALLIAVGIIIFSTFFVYINSLEGEFQFDDESSIVSNPLIKDLDNLKEKSFWISPFFVLRPVALTTYALNYHFCSLDVFSYHLTNILIHIINSLLLLIFIKQLLKIQNINFSKELYFLLLLSVLFFSLHPIQTQAVSYIVQRMTSLAAMFFLISVILYLNIRTHIEKNQNILFLGSKIILLILTYLMAIMSKQNSVTLPLVFFAIEIIILNMYYKRYSKLIIILLSSIVVVFICFLPFITQKNVEISGINSYNYFASQCKALFTYLSLIIFPIKQNIDYYTPLSESILNPMELAGLAIAILLLISAFFIKKIPALIRFGIAWIFIVSIIESTAIPIADIVVEHRMYLPMIGIAMIIFNLLLIIQKKLSFKKIIIVFTIYLIILSAMTINRNNVWKSKITLWSNSVENSPENPRALNNLGNAYLETKNYNEASIILQKALLISPSRPSILNNLGLLNHLTGNNDKALLYFNKVISMNKANHFTYINLGLVYKSQHKYSEAEKNFKKSLTIKNNYIDAYINLAELLLLEKKQVQSLGIIEKGLHIDPRNPQLNQLLQKIKINN